MLRRPLTALAALVVSLPLASLAAPRTCLVVAVFDGDTLSARCGTGIAGQRITVRFDGIDAPERHQPYGRRARQALAGLVLRKEVTLDCPKVDRYGRSVCTVTVAPASAPSGPRTLDAGLAMLNLGMAWWYRSYADEQTPQARGQYAFAEAEARARRVGLWRDAEQVAPWEWRRIEREAP